MNWRIFYLILCCGAGVRKTKNADNIQQQCQQQWKWKKALKKKESIDNNEEREHAYKLQGSVQFQMQKGTKSREQHGSNACYLVM